MSGTGPSDAGRGHPGSGPHDGRDRVVYIETRSSGDRPYGCLRRFSATAYDYPSAPTQAEGSFAPKLVAKHQRRLSGVEDLVISLSAKGLTTGEICAHLAEVYGAQVSKQTISTITDRVLEGMAEWQCPARPPARTRRPPVVDQGESIPFGIMWPPGHRVLG